MAWAPNLTWLVSLREASHVDTDPGRRLCVQLKAETAVTQLQVKKCLKLPATISS